MDIFVKIVIKSLENVPVTFFMPTLSTLLRARLNLFVLN
jgi:hypothetical protein